MINNVFINKWQLCRKLLFIIFFSFFITINCKAWYLPDNWSTSIDNDKNINLVVKEWDWVDQVYSYFKTSIIPITKSIMLMISIIYATILIFWLAISRWEEDIIKWFNKKIWWLILGLISMSIAEPLWEIFDPLRWSNAKELWNYAWFEALSDIIINSAVILIWWIAVLMMTISWFNILVAWWDLKTDEHKRNFVYSLSWIIIILLIRKFIRDIFYLNYWLLWPNESAVTWASSELFWAFAWAMQFLALACVWIIILWWVYYIFSLWDDKIWWQVKTMIKNVMIWLLIIMVSYTVVATFIPH